MIAACHKHIERWDSAHTASSRSVPYATHDHWPPAGTFLRKSATKESERHTHRELIGVYFTYTSQGKEYVTKCRFPGYALLWKFSKSLVNFFIPFSKNVF